MQHIPRLLRSPRLILKAPALEYAGLLQQAIEESIEDLKLWLTWAQYIPTIEECRENAGKAMADFNDKKDLQFYIFTQNDNTLIGCTGLHRIDWAVPKFEIGYWIRSSQQGQGYATETTNLIMRFAFEKLGANRVEIRCDENNLKSKSVARKSGFTLEGVLRNDTLTPDKRLRNTAIFSRVSNKN